MGTVIAPFITDSNEKIKKFTSDISKFYENDDTFYLQRNELRQLLDIIFKDSVYMVNDEQFTYKQKKHKVMQINLFERHTEMVRVNKLFFYHNFVRSTTTGDIMIQGTYVES